MSALHHGTCASYPLGADKLLGQSCSDAVTYQSREINKDGEVPEPESSFADGEKGASFTFSEFGGYFTHAGKRQLQQKNHYCP